MLIYFCYLYCFITTWKSAMDRNSSCFTSLFPWSLGKIASCEAPNVLHLYKLGSSCVEFILLFCKQLTNFGDIKVNFHRQWNPEVFVFKCSFRLLELLTHCAISSCVRFVLDCCTIEKPYVGLLRKRIPIDFGVSWPYIVDKKNYEKIKFALTFPLSCKWLQNILGFWYNLSSIILRMMRLVNTRNPLNPKIGLVTFPSQSFYISL